MSGSPSHKAWAWVQQRSVFLTSDFWNRVTPLWLIVATKVTYLVIYVGDLYDVPVDSKLPVMADFAVKEKQSVKICQIQIGELAIYKNSFFLTANAPANWGCEAYQLNPSIQIYSIEYYIFLNSWQISYVIQPRSKEKMSNTSLGPAEYVCKINCLQEYLLDSCTWDKMKAKLSARCKILVLDLLLIYI